MRINKRKLGINAVLWLLILISILLAAFVFSKAYLRCGQSCIDKFNSIGYCFAECFDIEHNIIPTVKDNIPVIAPIHPVVPDGGGSSFISINYDTFKI